MTMMAITVDFLASEGLGTVKYRMRMCGSAAVPRIRAMANDTKSRGSLYFIPGDMNASPVTCAPEGRVMLLFMMSPMNSNGPMPATTRTPTVRPITAIRSRKPLMNCTQVVETIPAVATMKTTRPPMTTTPTS